MTRRRRPLAPPPELPDHVSRAEAARLLGYPSVFRVRQLEREGRLRAARGVMGSAWYARRDVLALRVAEAPAPAPDALPAPAAPGPAPARRRSDAQLIAYLRGAVGSAWPPTVADLVADTGVSIARAQRVYRFWLTHDLHPSAGAARSARGRPPGAPPPAAAMPQPAPDAERRSPARLARAALIRELRAADPARRAKAFAALKNARPAADEV